jgi:bifunctional NMN adenylyltransferase/nudix hydrolase
MLLIDSDLTHHLEDFQMSERTYDIIAFIGRLEPPTFAHIEIIRQGLQYGDKVVVLAGSANQPRTTKNPFNVDERRAMIHACFPNDVERIAVHGIEDRIDNDPMWLRNIQSIVRSETPRASWQTMTSVGIIGHSKDDSSYYLQMFPQWDPLEIDNIDDINATDVRNLYFDPLLTLHNGGSAFETTIKDKLPPAIATYLMEFTNTEAYSNLVQEAVFLEKYMSQWAPAPYDVNFITTDAVVVQSGHILLIERRSNPGKGLWALPGGFLQRGKRIQDSMISELREETRLAVPVKILIGNIAGKEVFDQVERSLRGRTVTHGFYITLPPGPLSKVKGSDDAKKAKWIPIDEVLNMGNQMFEDHIHIIRHFIGDTKS